MKLKTLMLSLFVAAGAFAVARAADDAAAKTGADRQKMIEMHEKMAAAHAQAAACLKSGKPVDECRDALMKSCPMGKDGGCMMGGQKNGMCPMCGGKGMKGKGRGMGRGMGPGKDAPPVAPDAKPAEAKKP